MHFILLLSEYVKYGIYRFMFFVKLWLLWRRHTHAGTQIALCSLEPVVLKKLWQLSTLDSTTECGCKVGWPKACQYRRSQSAAASSSSPSRRSQVEKVWLNSRGRKLWVAGRQIMFCCSFPVSWWHSPTCWASTALPLSWEEFHHCPHSSPWLLHFYLFK